MIEKFLVSKNQIKTYYPGESLAGAPVVPGEVLGEATATTAAVAVCVCVQFLQVGRARLLHSVKGNLLFKYHHNYLSTICRVTVTN